MNDHRKKNAQVMLKGSYHFIQREKDKYTISRFGEPTPGLILNKRNARILCLCLLEFFPDIKHIHREQKRLKRVRKHRTKQAAQGTKV